MGDKVQVVFQSACPRNNLRTEDTFLTVERLDTATGNWSVVRMGGAAVTADLVGSSLLVPACCLFTDLWWLSVP